MISIKKQHKVKVFISGKVSGLDYYVAYEQFSNIERKLWQMGYSAINPMCICRKNWSWLRCMIVCLWHLSWCDVMVQLNNWQESKGARIEYKWAKLLGKTILKE